MVGGGFGGGKRPGELIRTIGTNLAGGNVEEVKGGDRKTGDIRVKQKGYTSAGSV